MMIAADGLRFRARTAAVCSLLLGVVTAAPRAAVAQSFAPPLVPPQVHYVVDVHVDTVARLLVGSGSATVHNASGSDLRALPIRWFDWRGGSYEITVAGVTKEYPSATESVLIPLATPLRPGATVRIDFRFRRALRDPERGFGLQRWHPYLWWGYETHASYDVGITAPADLVVGATARRDPADGRYRADHVRTFGLFFGRGFEVRERAAGATLVRSIFKPNMRECAELVLETAADAVQFYRQRLGMYPQASLTIIPAGAARWAAIPTPRAWWWCTGRRRVRRSRGTRTGAGSPRTRWGTSTGSSTCWRRSRSRTTVGS